MSVSTRASSPVGAALANNLDGRKLAFEKEYISNFALLGAALLFSLPVVFFKIQDHVAVEDDVANTDETIEEILPAGHSEKIVS